MRVQIVSFHCVLKNNLGQFISSSFNQEVATSSAEEQAFALPGLIKALKELKKGKKKKIYVPAGEAYGFYLTELVVRVPRSKLSQGKTLRVGDSCMGKLNGEDHFRSYRVIGAERNALILDGNHPLAGQDLIFEVEVTESRTEKEEPEIELLTSKKNGLLC